MRDSNNKEKILVVDDEPDMRWVLKSLLEKRGYDVITKEDGEQALEIIRRNNVGLVLLDIKIPKMTGIEVLEKTREIDIRMPIIMMTAYSDVRNAVYSMKLGAFDYLVKPFDNEELLLTIERGLEKKALEVEVTQLRSLLSERLDLPKVMGKSIEIQKLVDMIRRVATSDFCVLIQGESGTGKELVAEAIHANSNRSEGPLVILDCGAIPETLIESELFGYEKGAFTGAVKRKEGFFEAAHKGILFLDEISNLPKSMQMKLLRVIQTKQISHLGGTRLIPVDVRILCATNRDLLAAVKKGDFRRDLFYRINEFAIQVPPLRQRKDDLLYLANLFLNEVVEELNKKLDGFSKEVQRILLSYDWPGNVRELRNVVRRAALLADRKITPECFPDELVQLGQDGISMDGTELLLLEGLSWKELKKQNQIKLEKRVFSKLLERTGGNKLKASQILKMDYKTFHTKVKELGINVKG